MNDAPPSASARGYLTSTLPAVYTEPERRPPAGLRSKPPEAPFVVRWLASLEQVLDPTVTLLDNLAWHFDPATCPDDLVPEILRWLGLEAATDLRPDARRRLLRRAMALGRKRGTLAGLRELLGRAFVGLHIEVTHTGRATEGDDPRAWPPAAEPHVNVSCSAAITPTEEHALRRLVDDYLPAHVGWTLRIGKRGTGA